MYFFVLEIIIVNVGFENRIKREKDMHVKNGLDSAIPLKRWCNLIYKKTGTIEKTTIIPKLPLTYSLY